MEFFLLQFVYRTWLITSIADWEVPGPALSWRRPGANSGRSGRERHCVRLDWLLPRHVTCQAIIHHPRTTGIGDAQDYAGRASHRCWRAHVGKCPHDGSRLNAALAIRCHVAHLRQSEMVSEHRHMHCAYLWYIYRKGPPILYTTGKCVLRISNVVT